MRHLTFGFRSGSMSCTDRQPLANAPATIQIQRSANNRLGAVYSALYSFWSARRAATTANRQATGARRDAYSVILFNHTTTHVLTNDFTSSPNQLLGAVLRHQADGGTNFSAALQTGRAVMERNWRTERFLAIYVAVMRPLCLTFLLLRAPIMIFLSDGECSVTDNAIQDLCRTAVRLGWVIFFWCKAVADISPRTPLSFHSVSFGPDSSSSSLRRMANVALGIQNDAPRSPLRPSTASVPSSFAIALDTVRELHHPSRRGSPDVEVTQVRLAETFLGIAESLRKPRGSLMH